jgi:hypothetical protein
MKAIFGIFIGFKEYTYLIQYKKVVVPGKDNNNLA